ncbi:sensor histidine kinase [Nocardioides marmorisolisilvae]|uniref:histidine kinase n=1 Tax=Nocardioides marmorisolisilvae TaxID=1542737 RepID=A0A3N0DVE1_9ACTN|nr:histidine kinase [Nocardioides marmorisolisilvae]RNL79456.1 hypothetical protein EFL95_10750 [Nocardioides marmorisolisilvae]
MGVAKPARTDLVLGVALVAAAVLSEAFIATSSTFASLAWGIVIAGGVTVRSTYPAVAVLVTSIALVFSPQAEHAGIDPASLGVVVAALLAFTVAERFGWLATGLAVVVLTVSCETTASYIIPLFPVAIVGAAGVGWIMKSQRRVNDELAARGQELEVEREIFARESVRLERARIAHELHDIVAHCISVLVVQAGAGRRLTDVDPEAAAEALSSIAEVAAQAEQEITALVAMLGSEPEEVTEPGVAMIEELVARMKAARLNVRLRMDGSISELDAEEAKACYRVVQESLTNALKHSPGAEIAISVLRQGRSAEVIVHNGPPPGARSGLENAGGGNGTQSMAARLRTFGGAFESGPTAEGGWQVRALLPLAS